MDEIQLMHMADFLSIALEAMEREDYDVAEDFVASVQSRVVEELDE